MGQVGGYGTRVAKRKKIKEDWKKELETLRGCGNEYTNWWRVGTKRG